MNEEGQTLLDRRTVVGEASQARSDISLDETAAGGFEPETAEQPGIAAPRLGASSTELRDSRSTVLPSFDGAVDISRTNLLCDGVRRPRYQNIDALGSGAMGDVYLVNDNDIQRPVALKRLKRERCQPSTVVRFVEEIRTIGALEHPNIVPIHDVGEDQDGNLYFVMKYVDGETLEDIIEKLAEGDQTYHDRFTFHVRAQIFAEILRGVKAAHEHGIIHRDLKPANIMVGPSNEVMIMDWGLAKRFRGEGPALELGATAEGDSDSPLASNTEAAELYKTRHGSLLGTPAYMSPEQARGEHDDLDERSDLYSLGVIFYELMTLQHPLHDKQTLNSMLMAVCNEEPTPAWQVWHPVQGRIPGEYAHVIRRATRKDREERHGSAVDLATDLDLALQGSFEVQCASTFAKRLTNKFEKLLDRYPQYVLPAFYLGPIALLALIVTLAVT